MRTGFQPTGLRNRGAGCARTSRTSSATSSGCSLAPSTRSTPVSHAATWASYVGGHARAPEGGDDRLAELGGVPARVDDRHPDAERLQLQAHDLAEAVHRELRGRVRGLVEVGAHPDIGADVQDGPAALGPHRGDDGLRHAHGAQDVDLEHGPGLFDRRALHRPQEADARAVHEHVDPAVAVEDLAHGRLDRRLVGDVERLAGDADAGFGRASAAGRRPSTRSRTGSRKAATTW